MCRGRSGLRVRTAGAAPVAALGAGRHGGGR